MSFVLDGGGDDPLNPKDPKFQNNNLANNAIINFSVSQPTSDPVVLVKWTVNNKQNIAVMNVLRATGNNIGAATVIQSYGIAQESDYEFTDNSPSVALGDQFYWIDIQNADDSDDAVYGGATPALGTSTIPTLQLDSFDVSIGAASGGFQNIFIAFRKKSNDTEWDSTQVRAKGYLGNVNPVIIGQSSEEPFSIALQSTGEVVTFYGVVATLAGQTVAISGAPTKILILGAETVPAKLMNVEAVLLPSSVQINFGGGIEPDLDHYAIFRVATGGGFGAAVQIGQVTATKSLSYSFNDATGTAGHDWYVVAHNAVGNSSPSDKVSL